MSLDIEFGIVTTILYWFVILEHIYFLWLEMFMWTTPKGIKTFGLKSKDYAEDTKVLAANQGLYNGFLTAGLIYSYFSNNINFGIFFLICVTIAGIYGSYSTKRLSILYIQSFPALICLLTLVFS